MHARHVCNLQYRHSKIHQWGPEWQMLHVHWIRVLSDLTNLNECAQFVTTAMAALRPRLPPRVGEVQRAIVRVVWMGATPGRIEISKALKLWWPTWL